MAAEVFWGDTMTLTVTAPDDSTDVPVAGLQGVSIMLSAEHVELFTADSIEWETVKKRELTIPVEIEYAKWDNEFAKWWMDPSAGATSITDTSDVAFFSIDGSVTSDQDTQYSATVDDVYFEELPLFEASEGEFVSQSLSGTGKTVSDFSEPV